MSFIPYSHQSIGSDDIDAVTEVLTSDYLTQGPKVKEFEDALAKETGASYAVTFSSGTAALEAAYFAAGIKKGDEVITTPLTFSATANAALWMGAKVIFADVEEATGNLEPRDVERKITARTRAIVPVDYGGLPARLDELQAIAKRHRAVVIEDAAHSLGATYGGRKVGSIADMTMFSFHPVKSITTGEGGAVVTARRDWYERLLLFREHGITKDKKKFLMRPHGDWYYEMQTLGHNYRLTDIQAALGISQLKKLRRFLGRRQKLSRRYRDAFSTNPYLIVPCEYDEARSSWHLFPLRLKGKLVVKRSEMFKELRALGIGVQVHYIPVYFHPYYQKLGYTNGICPKAEAFYEAELSLPLFPDLHEHDQNFVIKTIHALTQL